MQNLKVAKIDLKIIISLSNQNLWYSLYKQNMSRVVFKMIFIVLMVEIDVLQIY